MTICASCCSMLQRVAMCHSALLSTDPRIRKQAKTLYNSVAGHCRVLQRVAVRCSVLQCVAAYNSEEQEGREDTVC